jgi:beta-xylosidase
MNEKPGFLRIYLSDKGELDQAENILLRNAPEGDFEVTTRVLFTPYSNFQFAGLLIYQDDGHFLKFGRAMCYLPALPPGTCVGNGLYFDNLDVDEGVGDEGYSILDSFPTSTLKKSEAYLRIVREGRTYTAFYSDDGINWQTIGRHESDLFPFYVGLIASQAYEQPAKADFDYFTLEALP